jgi:hypothetical protein
MALLGRQLKMPIVDWAYRVQLNLHLLNLHLLNLHLLNVI